MQTKKDISYGVIPVIKDKDQWKVFLIHQYGSGGDVYWTLPKGHPEENENPKEAALRELAEETGIVLESLNTEKEYTQSYTFPYQDIRIEKSVVYFLGIAASEKFEIQEDEVREAGWFSFDKALEQLSYENARILLREVAEDVAKI